MKINPSIEDIINSRKPEMAEEIFKCMILSEIIRR